MVLKWSHAESEEMVISLSLSVHFSTKDLLCC